MSDLIDRGKLKERLFPVVPDQRGVSKTETSLYMQGWNDAITSIIENEPSAETKKGRWIETTVRCSTALCCSHCGQESGVLYRYNYCPRCGAEMELDEVEE